MNFVEKIFGGIAGALSDRASDQGKKVDQSILEPCPMTSAFRILTIGGSGCVLGAVRAAMSER